MLPGRNGTAEEFGDLPTWLCAGSAPTTALGQASGLEVVTPPARPAAGTAGARGILQLCLLRLFQALCATCALLFWGCPLTVLDVVCFFLSPALSLVRMRLRLSSWGQRDPHHPHPEAAVFGLLLAPLSA